MLIKNKLKNIFSKAKSVDQLGISFRQKSLAFCYIPENEASQCHHIEVNGHDFLPALTTMENKYNAQGQCHLILTPQQAQIVQIDKPNVPVEEMNDALKWQVKDLVSYSPDDMVLDYFDGPKLAGGVEKVNVVCASLADLKKVVEPFVNNAFSLQTITTEEFAFSSLVPVQEDACLLVCQQPNEEVVLIIVKQGKLFFHRRLRGFTQLALKNDQELAMGVVDSLSLEIQRSSDYFERQLKQASIKSIEVIVPIEHEGFLARKLSENTNIPVNLLTMPIGCEAKRDCAAAIGATQLVKGIDNVESAA